MCASASWRTGRNPSEARPRNFVSSCSPTSPSARSSSRRAERSWIEPRSKHSAAANLSPASVADQLRPRERTREVLRVLEPALVVLAVFPHRQPFLGDGGQRRREARIRTRAVYDFPADHGQERLDVLDPVLGNLEVIGGKDR